MPMSRHPKPTLRPRRDAGILDAGPSEYQRKAKQEYDDRIRRQREQDALRQKLPR